MAIQFFAQFDVFYVVRTEFVMEQMKSIVMPGQLLVADKRTPILENGLPQAVLLERRQAISVSETFGPHFCVNVLGPFSEQQVTSELWFARNQSESPSDMVDLYLAGKHRKKQVPRSAFSTNLQDVLSGRVALSFNGDTPVIVKPLEARQYRLHLKPLRPAA